ncbi:MAG: spore germination protein [Firmicutes bacterium]|nr:spore germination protein [Bacillota bacterium]
MTNKPDIDKSLELNAANLKNKIGESYDTSYRYFKIPVFRYPDALIVYISGLNESRIIEQSILEPLMNYSKLPDGRMLPIINGQAALLMETGVFTTRARETVSLDEAGDAVIEGDTVLFIDHCDTALILKTKKYEGRSVEDPISESEIKGPRDGFVENIYTNTALIRRRVKDHGVRFDNMKIGARTKTIVSIAYIDSLVNQSLLKEVKSRLERINTDGILSSENIEELIGDAPLSVFPTIALTERPDKACAALLEGRVLVLVDNSPFVLIIPTVFWQFLTSSGDYYERFLLSTVVRWIRLFAMFLSISASSFYVLLTSFHQEMLPTALAMKVAAGRSGVPFPAILEAFIMEVILDIMKEAGLRMPKPIGQAVSIVGTLVIGQAAVAAGLVGPLMIIIIALAAISSYTIPSYTMGNTLRLIRFPILISTALFGLFGYLGGLIVLLLHLMSLRSFGTPYLAPVVPLDLSGNMDVFVRSPRWDMSARPVLARAKDPTRQGPDQKPKPPRNKRARKASL